MFKNRKISNIEYSLEDVVAVVPNEDESAYKSAIMTINGEIWNSYKSANNIIKNYGCKIYGLKSYKAQNVFFNNMVVRANLQSKICKCPYISNDFCFQPIDGPDKHETTWINLAYVVEIVKERSTENARCRFINDIELRLNIRYRSMIRLVRKASIYYGIFYDCNTSNKQNLINTSQYQILLKKYYYDNINSNEYRVLFNYADFTYFFIQLAILTTDKQNCDSEHPIVSLVRQTVNDFNS